MELLLLVGVVVVVMMAKQLLVMVVLLLVLMRVQMMMMVLARDDVIDRVDAERLLDGVQLGALGFLVPLALVLEPVAHLGEGQAGFLCQGALLVRRRVLVL